MNTDQLPATGAAVASAHAPGKRARGRPRKTAGERDDGNRRLELLGAAAHLFRQNGFAATSTRDIAAAVGMHAGSPFYHFKSKDALLYAVMQEGMRAAIARQAGALQRLPAKAPPLLRMRCLIRAHFDTLLGPGNDFVPVMLYERRSLSDLQRAALDSLAAEYESAWTPVLRALHACGQLRAPVKLSRLLILGALNWSVQWFDAAREVSLEQLTDAALALFLKE